MVRIRRGAMIGIVLGMLFLIGFVSVYWLGRSWVKIGQYRIRLNPSAKINPKKQYQLRFWDYDLPLRAGDQSYEQYLRRALDEFQQLYPNIRVELKLLDLLAGPDEFRRALAMNQGPDVYGGFYENPGYDFRYQIPVGLFLNAEERDSYPEAVRGLQSIDGILCALPRWLSANIWVGNRRILESCGVDVTAIQNQGWGWGQLLQIAGRLPEKTYLLTGKPIFADLTHYLYNVSKRRGRDLAEKLGPLQELLAQKKISPEIERNRITRFIEGQAALLAEVRPGVFSVAAREGATMGWEAVWLPAPGYGDDGEIQFVEGGFLSVYRNHLTKGDDHLAAAVKLARFLSNYPDKRPWISIGALPVPIGGELTGVSGFLNRLLTRSDVRDKEKRQDLETLISQWFSGQLDVKQFETGLDHVLIEKAPQGGNPD